METVSFFRSSFRRGGWIPLCAVLSTATLATAATPLRTRQVAAISMLRGHVAEPLAADTVRPAERAFLEKAVEASRLQMRLAELGASQAANSEVRSHAEQLKSDNRQLTDALTSLSQKKAATAPARPAVEPASDVYARIAEKSGADFDREFIRVMATLHEDTISLFEQAAADSKDADVRDLAAAQLPMLRAHLNRITELKKTFD